MEIQFWFQFSFWFVSFVVDSLGNCYPKKSIYIRFSGFLGSEFLLLCLFYISLNIYCFLLFSMLASIVDLKTLKPSSFICIKLVNKC